MKILKLAVALAMILLAPAQAAQNLILDITPVAPRSTDGPFTFNNIPVWTPIWVSRLDQGYPVVPTPSAACFTCFFQILSSNDIMKPAKNAWVTFAILGSTSNARVRLMSFYNDYSTNPATRVVKSDWNCDLAPPAIGGPSLVACDITAKWNALWTDPLMMAQQHAFYYEVIGSGAIYMARMTINYLP